MTNESHEELISAALDGERVDVQALKEALSTADGRDALASFLLLRAAVAADTTQPRTRGARALTDRLARGRLWGFGVGPRIPLGIAASIAALFAAGSFWIGTARQAGGIISGAGQPAAQASSAPAVPPTSIQSPTSHPQEGDAGVPPTPTRVMRFTPGVDWHEGS